jgi:hypothetical protein
MAKIADVTFNAISLIPILLAGQWTLRVRSTPRYRELRWRSRPEKPDPREIFAVEHFLTLVVFHAFM